MLTCFAAQGALAQQPRVAELAEMSLEQLAEVQLVSAASKHAQRPADAPAVITVITADEIKRHGYRTLGDVLRTLPSFSVTYDRNYSYVGVRGFGRPGDYNTRILLLIDGVRTNDNIYDGAYVAREFVLDLDVVDRIEVSRGPGASIYGNSAFFAVINVVSKRGGALQGAELRADAGSFGTWGGRASYGRRLDDGAEFLASLTTLDSAGQRLRFPEFAAADAGGAVAGADAELAHRGLASFSKGGLSLQAVLSRREKRIPTASFGTVFGDTRSRTRDDWGLLAGGYERLGARVDWSARASFGAYDYSGDYAYGALDSELYRDGASGRWWNAESVVLGRFGRHTLLAGTEFQGDLRQRQQAGYPGASLSIDVRDRGSRLALFAQDDVKVGERLRLSLGARYDRNLEADRSWTSQASPRLALIATPAARTTVKLLYGTAFRAPNEYELHYYGGRQSALAPETIRSLEAAVEHSLAEEVSLSGSVFSNRIRDLISLNGSADELFFANAGRIDSRGAELSVSARWSRGLSGRFSYSFQDTRDDAGLRLTNFARHMLKANAAAPLLGQKVWASFDAQYLSARGTLSGSRTNGFVLVNATLLSQRFKSGIEVSASVYNLFDARYADPGSEEHVQDVIPQDGRSFALRLGWRF